MKRLISGLHNRYALPLLTLLLVIAGYIYLRIVGDTYTVKIHEDIQEQYALESAEENETLQDTYKAWVSEDSKGDVEILGIIGSGTLNIRGI